MAKKRVAFDPVVKEVDVEDKKEKTARVKELIEHLEKASYTREAGFGFTDPLEKDSAWIELKSFITTPLPYV
jgi:hypothetical protein